MKKPVQISKYLLSGLILLISLSGNQIKEASRIKGLRRNWEIIATHRGTEFPTFRDNGVTNTTISTECKLECLHDMSYLCSKVRFNRIGLLSCIKNDAAVNPTKRNSNNGGKVVSSPSSYKSGKFNSLPESLKYAFYYTILRNNRSALYNLIPSVKETLRYLERLPGH